MTFHWKAIEQYFTVVLFVVHLVILQNVSVLDFALSGVKGLSNNANVHVVLNGVV